MLLNLREIGDLSSNDTYLEMERMSSFKARLPRQSILGPTSKASTTLKVLSSTGGGGKQTIGSANLTRNRTVNEELARASESPGPDRYVA